VIGANSFVNKNIPPYSIAYGIPAKKIGNVKITKDKIKLEYLK
jgi:serine acetyltransferase